MPPDEPNDEERLEELPGDEETPFRPAGPSRDDSLPADDDGQPDASTSTHFDDTQPITDTDVDQQELYDAGEAAAASGPDEPHDDPTVVDYRPPDEAEGSPS